MPGRNQRQHDPDKDLQLVGAINAGCFLNTDGYSLEEADQHPHGVRNAERKVNQHQADTGMVRFSLAMTMAYGMTSMMEGNI